MTSKLNSLEQPAFIISPFLRIGNLGAASLAGRLRLSVSHDGIAVKLLAGATVSSKSSAGARGPTSKVIHVTLGRKPHFLAGHLLEA